MQAEMKAFESSVDEAFGAGKGAMIRKIIEAITGGDVKAFDPKIIEQLLAKLTPLLPFLEKAGPFLKIAMTLLPLILAFASKDESKPTNVTTI
jgi:hypothetical protein